MKEKKTKQKETNILNFKIKKKSTYKFFEQNNLKGFFGPVLKSRKKKVIVSSFLDLNYSLH